jgi:hypothetical protein
MWVSLEEKRPSKGRKKFLGIFEAREEMLNYNLYIYINILQILSVTDNNKLLRICTKCLLDYLLDNS